MAPDDVRALMLPVDGCGNCLTLHDSKITHPHRVVVEGAGLRAWYRCGDCGHAWWTGWSVDALELGCPGCRYCREALGGAA